MPNSVKGVRRRPQVKEKQHPAGGVLAGMLSSALASLTPEEEHELLQGLLASVAMKGSAKKDENVVVDTSLEEEQVIFQSNNKDVQSAMEKAEEKIGRALNASVDNDGDADDDEGGNDKTSLPNLKYAQPKYKNIESILKYNETPNDKGMVKLVIMNFND